MWRNCQKYDYLCPRKKASGLAGKSISCPYSLMDRITDSGSVGCGSIPHGGTKCGFGCFLLGDGGENGGVSGRRGRKEFF